MEKVELWEVGGAEVAAGNTYRDYTRRTAEIRSLSTPSLKDIACANDYAKKLRENFKRIGALAAKKRDFLETVFIP